MPNTTSATALYLQRFARLLRQIDAQLDQTLRFEQLAALAHYSPHHFNRQFSALFGISPHTYVQLSRFKRAAWRLAYRQHDSITAIALDSGYENPESFSRAFRQQLGLQPSAFRLQPPWRALDALTQPLQLIRNLPMHASPVLQDVRIIEQPAIALSIMQHHGDPLNIGDTIRRFIAWRKQHHLHPSQHATYNIFYNDPHSVPSADYRCDLGVVTDGPIVDAEHGISAGMIPAGRVAVLRHIGSDDTLAQSIAFLYGQWLPQSGEQPRDFPLYAQRVTFFPDVPEHEAVVDLYLPLR